MIILITGVPGSGKTLSTIKFISEDTQFNDRPVFYHNIKDCKLDWTKLTDDQALNWYDLPDGAVIVFDECQDLFPVNTSRRNEPPPVLSMMAKHRHKGFDLVLITQEPRNIDSFVRRLVGLHRHYARHFGTGKVKCYEWQNRCCDNVHDYHEKNSAIVSQSKLDKKYFGAYHSAEIHTQKPRLPYTKLAVVLLPMLALPLLVWYAVTFWTSKADEDIEGPVVAVAPAQTYDQTITDTLFNQYPGGQGVQVGYLESMIPRVAGVDFTAPVYDEVREVRTYPKPLCVASGVRDRCSCLTQQGTRIQIDHQQCLDIVENGVFDYSLDTDRMEGRKKRGQAERSQPDRSFASRDREYNSNRRRAFLIESRHSRIN